MPERNGTDLTLREAAEVLEPSMTERQLRDIIRALGWPPAGHRASGRRGHPRATYPAADILRLHAALSPWLGS